MLSTGMRMMASCTRVPDHPSLTPPGGKHEARIRGRRFRALLFLHRCAFRRSRRRAGAVLEPHRALRARSARQDARLSSPAAQGADVAVRALERLSATRLLSLSRCRPPLEPDRAHAPLDAWAVPRSDPVL